MNRFDRESVSLSPLYKGGDRGNRLLHRLFHSQGNKEEQRGQTINLSLKKLFQAKGQTSQKTAVLNAHKNVQKKPLFPRPGTVQTEEIICVRKLTLPSKRGQKRECINGAISCKQVEIYMVLNT